MCWKACRFAAIVMGVAVATAAVATAQAAEPRRASTPGRSGGLVPTSKAGMSREELIRSWDLDRDGTISSAEAEVARARMKRDRLELGASIDPLTGRPRSESASTEDEDAANEPRYRLPPALPEAAPATPGPSSTAGAAPSTRPKSLAELSAPLGATPSSPESPGAVAGPEGTTPPPAGRSSRASWLPPAQTGPIGIGGPRAGAPAAVSGYGAGAWSNLNAGRPRATDQHAGTPASGVGQTPLVGRGHVPSTLPPGRTGALILPGQTLPQLAPLAPAPPPLPRYTPPRISAQEMGGYRP
jgi:hypothetical protein